MTIGELREMSGLNIKDFAAYLNIPYRTVQGWIYGERKCPEYILELIEFKLLHQNNEK